MGEKQSTQLELPPPGTRDDLLSDARALEGGLKDRYLDELERLGLLGRPARRRSGQTGQLPAIYSGEQRALFQAVIRNKAQGAKNAQLASIPVFAWLNWGDDWVDSTQLHRALTTAVGKVQRSARSADVAAKAFVNRIDVPRAGRALGPALALRELVSAQLQAGWVNVPLLRKAVYALYKPGRVEIVQGPVGAPLTADVIVAELAATMSAAGRVAKLTDAQLNRAQAQHQESWAEYQLAVPALRATAGPRFEAMFDDLDFNSGVSAAVPVLLSLIGINMRNDAKRSTA